MIIRYFLWWKYLYQIHVIWRWWNVTVQLSAWWLSDTKWCCLVSKRLASKFIIFENRLLLPSPPPEFICLFQESTTQDYYVHPRVWNIFFGDNWNLRVITSHSISIVDKTLRNRYAFHKISAWGYEILADLTLDSVWVKKWTALLCP